MFVQETGAIIGEMNEVRLVCLGLWGQQVPFQCAVFTPDDAGVTSISCLPGTREEFSWLLFLAFR